MDELREGDSVTGVDDDVGEPTAQESTGENGWARARRVAGRVTSPIWPALLGAALVASLAAIALAVYSLHWATRTWYDRLEYLSTPFADWWGAQAASRIATNALWVAIPLAVAVVAAVVSGTASAWAPVIVISVVGLGYFVIWKSAVMKLTRLAMANFVRAEQLPTAVAAWTLAAVATIAALAAALLHGSRRRPGRAALAIGAVLGLLAAGLAGSTAWRAGDDSRVIDATTAAAAPVLPVPDILGQRHFHLKVADETSIRRDGNYAVRVVAGGAGFLLLKDGVLTAYNHDGGERWHYRRSRPSDLTIDWFEVYGDVVIIRTAQKQGAFIGDHHTVVALDAVTGRRLWSSDNFGLTSAVGSGYGLPQPSWHLVVHNESRDQFTAYDPATKRRLQTVHMPEHCSGDAADTKTRLVVVASCRLASGRIDVRVLSADPGTGQIVFDQHLFDRPAEGMLPGRITPAGIDGVQMEAINPESPRQQPFFFNAVSGRLAALAPEVSLYPQLASRDSAGDFLVSLVEDASTKLSGAALYGSDALRRCTLPAGTNIRHWGQVVDPLFLGRQILISEGRTSYDLPDPLQLINRTDCANTGNVPTVREQHIFATIAAPGVSLIAYTDFTGTYIDGYY